MSPVTAPKPSFLLFRSLARNVPAVAVIFTLVHLARGGFRQLEDLGGWEAAAAGLLLVGIALSATRRRRRSAVGAPPNLREDLELGGTLIAATWALVSVGGHPLYPLSYLVMAFLVSLLPRAAGFTLLGVALVFDGLLTLAPPEPDPQRFGIHAAFLLLFATLYYAVLNARLAMSRKAEGEAVQNRIREVEERARTFRLVSSGTQDSFAGMKEEEKWLVASVKEIEGAVGAALEIAEIALGTHSCSAFLLTSDDRYLKLYDSRTGSEKIQRDRFPAGEGILGGILKRSVPVRMSSKSGLKGVTWYEAGAPEIQSLLAVPIVEAGGQVRGVLVADRLGAEAFTENDERLLATIAGEVLRAIEVERVMNYIRKSRDEKDQFFRAIEELNRAGNPDQVFPAVLDSARQLGDLDFCAVTLVSELEGKRVHRIARMTGVTTERQGLEGYEFPDNSGLVATVVRYGALLPGRDVRAMDKQVIFDNEIQVRGLSALKIFPLVAGNLIVGTLVAGSRRKGALGHEVVRMLEVIAIQAGQAVLRAQLYEKMETMATTDGLTGLLNHRTFQQKADEALAHAKRYGRKCSLILTDIDHFKTVNDGYGHPTGDMVLKGVARILRAQARDTDIVARYGGEEFAIIMPETDTAGARIIAERIREAVKAETFQTDMGPLNVTLSLGVGTFPDHGTAKQEIIDLADQCLYHAKRHGRNQTVTVAEMKGGRKLRAAGGVAS